MLQMELQNGEMDYTRTAIIRTPGQRCSSVEPSVSGVVVVCIGTSFMQCFFSFVLYGNNVVARAPRFVETLIL
jgi:hypothetical protein